MSGDESPSTFPVRVGLAKNDEAEGILRLMERAGGLVTVSDRGAYWLLEAPGEIVIDTEELADELGHEVTVEELLGTFASYAGRAEIEGNILRVTSSFPQLDGSESGG